MAPMEKRRRDSGLLLAPWREQKAGNTLSLLPLNTSATFGTRRSLTTTLEEALPVVLAYGWAVDDASMPYGADNPYLWAYHSYDTVLQDTSNPLEAAVFAANGLNAGMSATTQLRILAKIDAGELPDLGDVPPFWTLDPRKLNKDPRDNSPEGILWRWYRTMKAISDVGGAVSAKVGFHLAPHAMPLWDSVVGKYWSPNNMWGELANNIVAQAEWLDTLEYLVEYFRVNFRDGDGVSLNRSRLVDILTWSEGVGQFDNLLARGRRILNSVTDPATW